MTALAPADGAPQPLQDAPDAAWPLLRSPFRIGGVELRNRFVFQPHFTALGGEGDPSDDHRAYYEERAAGGAGLIIFESQAVHPTGRVSRHTVNAWDEANLPAYRRIVEAVHRHGAKFFSQLVHSGPDSLAARPSLMWGPTQMPEPSGVFATKAMELSDIAEVVEHFALSAVNMHRAGFDGVEVKIGHDGLLHAFASPFLNRRTDHYGGDFTGRLRMSVEVLQAIRDRTPADFVVGVRLCVNEYTEWGYDTEYGLQMARHLEATGLVDYFNTDAGTSSSYWMQIPPTVFDEGSFRELNRRLKETVSCPVVAFGRIKHPEVAERILAAGEADLIGMARQLVADPATPRKVIEGREEDIRYCIAGNDSCIFQVSHEQQIRCDHNPAAGRERLVSERLLRRTETPLSVLVVGGGPAGLKAAETLARRGHGVTLFEKDTRLGGQLLLAEKQPHHVEIYDVVDHLERALRRLRVEVNLGAEITADALEDIDADVVVLATGSRPALSRVGLNPAVAAQEPTAGLDHFNTAAITDIDPARFASVDDVLSGRRGSTGRVLVIDGSGQWEGAGTAEFLANAGAEVVVIAAGAAVGASLETANRHLFHQRAAAAGMRLLTRTAFAGCVDGTALLRDVYTGQVTELPGVDLIVPAVGRRSAEELYLDWAGRIGSRQLHRVGDCVAPRLLREVIRESYDFALGL
ncbi:MAG: NemA [Modestobacter sp.]|jgi:2,4-dienoyl-CoA reductase-like NADH-dependent reductase (Old Yellow Enzyme family)|nr:NemA [Modestobacter sp.]